jgi:hypothetical protein
MIKGVINLILWMGRQCYVARAEMASLGRP